jgi:hypothetical protein
MPSTLSATAGCVQSLHINLASGLRNPSHCASSLWEPTVQLQTQSHDLLFS